MREFPQFLAEWGFHNTETEVFAAYRAHMAQARRKKKQNKTRNADGSCKEQQQHVDL